MISVQFIYLPVFPRAETSKAATETNAELELMYFVKDNNICISDVPKWKSPTELNRRSSVVVQFLFSFPFSSFFLTSPSSS